MTPAESTLERAALFPELQLKRSTLPYRPPRPQAVVNEDCEGGAAALAAEVNRLQAALREAQAAAAEAERGGGAAAELRAALAAQTATAEEVRGLAGAGVSWPRQGAG
jgi:hypothetical protein